MIYISSFLLGIGSSWHCLGMCGPLVMAVPFPKKRQSIITKALYFLGKAIAYALLGMIIGLFGMKSIWGDSQRYVSIVAGSLIVLMVLFPIIIPKTFNYPFKKTFNQIFNRMKEQPQWWHFLSLGFLNGLLPCGMVYMALIAALASGNSWNAALVMLLFGLGTTPMLWVVSFLKDRVRNQFQAQFKLVTVSFGLLAGTILILRGLNLGIPYISPNMNKIEHHVQNNLENKKPSNEIEGMHCH